MIIAIVYAGSFVLMEENTEKTEKTERSEEALQHFYSYKAFALSLATKTDEISYSEYYFKNSINQQRESSLVNYNISFIYTTSFLDSDI